MFTMYYIGGSVTVAIPTFTFYNCTIESQWVSDTVNNVTDNTQTSTKFIMTFIIEVTGPFAYFALTGGTLPTSITSADMFVT